MIDRPAEISESGLKILEARYLQRDEGGQLAESPHEMFQRVARSIAAAEEAFGGQEAVERWEREFFDAMGSLDFLPNSPTLMNAGTAMGQLGACFVLPVDDSIADIFDSLRLMALVQQSGGGTGFSFSRLRPLGDTVRSSGGPASGPVSFMRIFDFATDKIRQGGRRCGANMGVLRVDHPDIEIFIDAKRDQQSFQHFNLSVGVTDAFMRAVDAGEAFALRHPASREIVREVEAAALFEKIARAAWESGDPGIVFLDAVARGNPTPQIGEIEATNPCGEVPLLPFEACVLGSINLSHLVGRAAGGGKTIDWDNLARLTRLGVRFLDDAIEVGRWPEERITAAVRANRKIGLGVMGFAEFLILLGIPYDSDEAAETAEQLMAFISREARDASVELARERGVFPNWSNSVYAERDVQLRNATLTSIAPTGTISIIAGTSPGIEPLFALAYRRCHVLGDETLPDVNPLVLRDLEQRGLDSTNVTEHLRRSGSLAGLAEIPRELARLFETALEIPPAAHLRVQAAFQSNVDNAVSKTINLPNAATPAEVAEIYHQAWQRGLKGITIYRYGSKADQVLELGS